MEPWHSFMKFARNSRVEFSVTCPSSVTSPGVNWMYASMALNCGELQKARMLRRCCWPTAVPILPEDAPIMADGLRANEFVPHGRLAQSIAFLSAPGIDRLYSGVTKSTASTEAIASFNARPAGG